MNDILKKLYNGGVNPSARLTTVSLDYKKSSRKASEAEEALCQTFSEEQEQLFEEYQRLEGDLNHIDRTDKFAYGFRLGLMMAIDAYETKDEYMR